MANQQRNSDEPGSPRLAFAWQKYLTCPGCNSALVSADNSLFCETCPKSYPFIGNKPLLLPTEIPGPEELAAFEQRLAEMEPREFRQSNHPEDSDFSSFQAFFFGQIFPQLNSQDPQWRFLAEQVFQMRSEIRPGSIVLDIGAGECKYAPLFGHCRYLGFDFAQLSSEYDFTGLDFIGDATRIPLADGMADVALNFAVLEHVPSIGQAISEMSRVLKPGGTCYSLIPLVRPEHMVPYDFNRLTRYGIRKNFEDYGLEIERLEESNGAFWTAAFYLRQVAATEPLRTYGRRSLRGMLESVFWRILLEPLTWYGRKSNARYNRAFPIYFFVKAIRKA